MVSWVVINRHVIRENAKTGSNKPPIRITRGKYGKPHYAHEIRIDGSCRLIYDAKKPVLPCGARLAIRCDDQDIRILR